MFQLFRKDNNRKRKKPKLADFDGNPLKEGDVVESLRYDLGKCKLFYTDEGYVYESLESGKRVSWAKMIDASTENQKVRKIEG
jgi:hypothetical protein